MRAASFLFSLVLLLTTRMAGDAAEPAVGDRVVLKLNVEGRDDEDRIVDEERVFSTGIISRVRTNDVWLNQAWIKKDDVLSVEQALAYYTDLIENDPGAQAFYRRGVVWSLMEEHERALDDLSEALRRDPSFEWKVLSVRCGIWFFKWEFAKALSDSTEAIRLEPTKPAPYQRRGIVWMATGQYDKAIEDFNEAIRLAPALADPYVSRGNARYKTKDYEAAVNDYQAALSLDPAHPMAFFILAWLRSTCPDDKFRNGDEAVALAFKALDIHGLTFPEPLDALAAAYAEAGDFAAAVTWEREALSLVGNPDQKAAFQSRLDLYLDGQPYRDDEPEIVLTSPPSDPSDE